MNTTTDIRDTPNCVQVDEAWRSQQSAVTANHPCDGQKIIYDRPWNVESTWCSRKKFRSRKLETFSTLSRDYTFSNRSRKVVVRKQRALAERQEDEVRQVRLDIQASTDFSGMASAFLTTLDNKLDTCFLKLLEDIMVFMVLLFRARDKTDIMLAVSVFIKLRTGRALVSEASIALTQLADALFAEGPKVQAEDPSGFESGVTGFRDLLAKWEEIKETSLGKKYLKLTRYLTAYGVFSFVGIEPSTENLKKAESFAGKVNHVDFMHCILDTCSFTLQRALMFSRTGEWAVFLHGPKAYGDWYDKCLAIKRQSYSAGNLEAQGTDYFKFVSDMKDCIEEGHAIVKFASRELKSELKSARLMLHEILLIEASILTKKAAQQERRAPFAVLVHGESSVAKSLFQKMLFFYYGKLMGLPTTADYKYVRNPADQYWSGFSSQAWCIQLDDVGFLNPAKATEDLSLTELISLVNNVPLVPNQADLADKGKTPVRARFVVASSNAKHMNASAYFFCPLAVQRRLPWVITVEPRKEFARADAPSMIDPSKMASLEGDWPDFWNISVDKVIPGGKAGDRAMASFENICKFGNTKDFLEWFGPICKEFDAIQGKAMRDDLAMADFEMCQVCSRVKCECMKIQAAGDMTLPEGVTYGEDFERKVVDGIYCEHSVFHFIGKGYICKTRIYHGGKLSREFVAPVNIVDDIKVQAQPSSVDYADILREVIDRQKKKSAKTWVQHFTCSTITLVLSAYIRFGFVRSGADYLLTFWVVRHGLKRFIANYVPPSTLARQFLTLVGVIFERAYANTRWRRIILGSFTAVAAWLTYRKITNWSVQGSVMSVPNEYFKKTEKENVWKRDDYQTTTFDIDPLSDNYATLDEQAVISRISRNTARIDVRANGMKIPGNAFCIGGHLWVTNSHIFPKGSDIDVEMRVDPGADGVSRNVKFVLEQSSLFRKEEQDLVFFEVLATDARPDLSRLVAKKTLAGGFTAKYVGLDAQCKMRMFEARCATRVHGVCDAHDRMYEYWRSVIPENTVNGDCGTVLVSMKPTVAVLGLHQLGGSQNMAFAVVMTEDDVVEAKTQFVRPIVQSGVPVISGHNIVKHIGPLHHKSPLRWLTTGSIAAFGSYLGYRVKSRSKVCATFCGDYIKTLRGWDIAFGAPDLKDWRPWHLAYKDIVEQKNVMKTSVIQKAVRGYVKDICHGLTEDSLSNFKVLSDHAAVNGIAGVQYIDKMNFNTSMGEPYCKSKKWFLRADPTPDQPEAKMFAPEILERAHKIEDLYRRGIRACPVFSGQVKDEPRSWNKIALGKLRIFTGAPVDWSLIVRKYLLTFVKVVQENQILFEAAPGCVAQSLEWEGYRTYLVRFGLDRMVAGDYGKFDKKMSAEMILAAFEVIVDILKHAGWGDEDLLVIHCIAEDTAYSFANFDGDLVMFFGSNPSGHPLTVIINSIVNALYMRYCYLELNALQECDSFKENVSLLTYGDDNVMGVSRETPWFNHTAIVQVLGLVGIEYTMADKESVSVPYIHIDQVSFLKRTWRWDDQIGAFVCPLEEESIRKMLCLTVKSKTVSEEIQMISVMNSALCEWFYYGRERFEKERVFLLEVVKHSGLDMEMSVYPFPTWKALNERFWRASHQMMSISKGGIYSHPDLVQNQL